MIIVEPRVELVQSSSAALQLIESAGRTCYQSEGHCDPETFIRRLIQRGHESVLEHASASFRIICDRGVSHELVRHRIASYSQESTRYCNYQKSGLQFIEPPDLTSDQHMAWGLACARAEESYSRMVGSGCSPQIARSVLPNCLKTELVMTANFREWRHFIKLRCAPAAHPQMRQIAVRIRGALIHRWPAVFDDLADIAG